MKLVMGIPFICLCLFIILGGCHSFSDEKSQKTIGKGEEGFITDLDDKRILIKDTYYKVNNHTDIQDEEGNKLSYSDLMIGMKVKPWYQGEIENSFPSKAEAELIRVIQDEQSIEEQKAVTAALKHVTQAVSQRFMVLKIIHFPAEHVYNIEMMNRSNLDSSFTVTVEDSTEEILYIK
ncbi:DUF3221 domain-containing protein [Peribacillus sp. NPDC097675]|uniref:DUF3221 domain-containing protein n=1 Tax=Peribacillus sp. NPDC097675 TaxID=3390618 RepID=UPI003D00D0F2